MPSRTLTVHECPDTATLTHAQLAEAALTGPAGAALAHLIEAHGLREIGKWDAPRLMGHASDAHSFSAATARRIAALFELARRYGAAQRDEGAPIRSPRDVYSLMAPRIEDAEAEEFHALCLDAQHRLAYDVTVTRGILNSSLVHPREVFAHAITRRAAAIILVHNHPSGDPTPSADDRLVTEQLVAAGRLLDMPVHDHVIVGRGRYVSFAEAGLL
jgi:DNA repair protein RadC